MYQELLTIVIGVVNASVSAIDVSQDGKIANGGGTVSWSCISPSVTRIEIKSSKPYVGARFTNSDREYFYGVWEYPFSGSLINSNVSFDLKGVGNNVGINWSNARAPFFISSAGYGVYADTPHMGSFDFRTPGVCQFVFNTSSLTYYIITSQRENDFKSIIKDYTGLSARSTMPPDSAYGPTFYSDDFEQDFHGYVQNAQQNYYDVVDHLYFNQIHGSALFADRKSLAVMLLFSFGSLC